MRENRYLFLMVTLFNSLYSMHSLNDPSFFRTKRTGAPHGDTLGRMKPFSAKSSSCFFISNNSIGVIRLLLTLPPSVGYVQNPLSLYYCYEQEGSTSHLKKCIAEVTNTPWGERVYFDFDPASDVVAKALHVSPFMDMLGNWTIKATSPGDDLSMSVMVQHPDLGAYFTAILKAKKIPASMVSDQSLFFWLMPHKVAVWIYWQALKLWWKGVPLVQHPRYGNEDYKEEAILRDQNLRCCNLNKAEPSVLCGKVDHHGKAHGFTWRDAKWPWC